MPEYYISKAARSSNKKCAVCNNKVAIIYDSDKKQLICKTCSVKRKVKEIGGTLVDLPILYRKAHLCEKCECNKCRYEIIKSIDKIDHLFYGIEQESVLICNECLSNYLGYN